ncbi:DNA-deoxyinosine glycosylase [Guggenheimella bovis]
MRIVHPIEPFIPQHARILILGSFPSVKSRKEGFFYANPQNQFWKILASVFEVEVPLTLEEKKAFLIRFGIALYDTVYACSIEGSSDSSIKDVIPADIHSIVKKHGIERIFCNGTKSFELFKRYQKGLEATLLTSSSPRNATYRLEDKILLWQNIRAN